MGFSVTWSWFAVLSCLFCIGVEVWCDCTLDDLQFDEGSYSLTKQLRSGSILIYNCPNGYYPYPHLTHTCQLNSSWRPSMEKQKCKMVECPDPTVLEYGDVLPPQTKYFAGNVTTYECYSGYALQGSDRRVCLPSGKWSGSTPICSHDSGEDCPDPGIPPGGSRIGNVFSIGEKVKYSCNTRMFLVGSSERVCQENGQWTGIQPECYYKHTFDTPLDTSEVFSSAIKDTLTTLESNDTQQGKTVRLSKSGILNMYIALDISESIDEENITDAKNAIISLITKISSFTVTPNYEIVFFSSELIKIVDILDFINGTVVPETFMTKLENFKLDDYNTAGTNLKAVFDNILDQMSFIQDRVGVEKFKEHHHAIILFTDGVYNMGGSPAPTVQKIKNLVYMNHIHGNDPNPREEFLDIYIFGIGAEIFDEDLQPLTVGTGHKHYFRLNNIENLQQTFDDMIDEGDLKGLCGLHKADDMSKSKRRLYPWWAQVKVQQNGPTIKCFGSLVTPRFILTAAHCFKEYNTVNDVTVTLDDGEGTVKNVEDFIIHPEYNIKGRVDQNVSEFYDYDVALVKLTHDVKISAHSRPICLPCTLESNIALKLPKGTSCEEQENLLLMDKLRLGFLTNLRGEITQKESIIRMGSARSPCIDLAKKATNIIKTENVEIAVTENFLCSGGKGIDFRSDITCKGDSGGAVFRDYEHRTIQIAIVSWGNEDVCKSSRTSQNSRDFFINLFKVIPFLRSKIGNSTDKSVTSLTFLG